MRSMAISWLSVWVEETKRADRLGPSWSGDLRKWVYANGRWRVVADLEILQHALAKCGHKKLFSL
jgi:hypothetical protein